MNEPSETSLEESESEFFERCGPMPIVEEDDRHFPRYFYRSCAEAIIHPLDGSEATPTECFLLTRDLSRRGLSLIHHEQLPSGQRLDVILNGEAPRPVEVVRCEPWIDGRFVIGCRFLPGASFDVPADDSRDGGIIDSRDGGIIDA